MPPVKKSPKSSPAKPRPSRARTAKKTTPTQVVSAPVVPDPTRTSPASSRAYLKPVVFGLVLIALGAAAFLYKDRFIVALVNGQPITRSEYITSLEMQGGQQVLDQLITETLISQEASTKGVTVAEADVDAEIETIQQQVTASGQDFDQLLSLQGTTLEQLRKQIRLRLQVEQLTSDVAPVTDEEVSQYLQDQAESLPDITSENQAEIETFARQEMEQTRQSEAIQTLIQNLQANADIKYW